MKQNAPTVSVCVASYNHGPYLVEMLNSVFGQTVKGIEVIVVDDGSTDNSLEILKNYSEIDDRLRVFTHPKLENRGISATTNIAIQNSKGGYVTFIGSDDVWNSTAVESLLNNLRANPHLGFVYGKVHRIDTAGIVIGEFGADISRSREPIKAAIMKNQIPAMAVMVRRECLDAVGYLDENIVYGDWELWIRLLDKFKVGFVDEYIAQQRVHETNTSIGISPQKQFKLSMDVLVAIQKKKDTLEFELTDSFVSEAKNALETGMAMQYLDEYFNQMSKGNLTQGTSNLVKAVRTKPSIFFRPKRFGGVIKHGSLGALNALFTRKSSSL